MEKKKQQFLFGSLKVTVCAAILAAMSIVLGKYLAFNLTPVIRISFENLPVIISGVFFGPAVGAAVGAVADLLGCVMVGYAINPIITAGAALVGLTSGLISKFIRKNTGLRAILSVTVAHILGSVTVKTIGLCVFYQMPFFETLLLRTLTYTAISIAESVVIYILLKNKAFTRQIDSVNPTKKTNQQKEDKKMTYQDALDYIHSVCWKGSRPGLERTTELLQKIGNPQDKLKFIHVAGTNGKGSFCSMTANVLKKSGYKVGLYTSPFVLRFNERMRINGEDIPDDTLAQVTEFVKPFAESMQDSPTEFELITVIALEYFAREGCDVVVFECGMGGRLDSTNVIKTPLLSVITGIALDHTDFLGDSIPKIAAEKAGIIKPNVPVLFCGSDTEAKEVIQGVANERCAPFYEVNRGTFVLRDMTLDGSTFDFGEFENVRIPLLGEYQPLNATNVLCAIEHLRVLGMNIPDSAIYDGLSDVEWKARFEIISKNPLIISDGGHNPEGITAAVNSIKKYFPDQKVIFLCGVMADKNYEFMASKMSEVAQGAVCIKPDNPRALSAEDFADVFEGLGVEAHPASSVKHGLDLAISIAKQKNTPVVCLGSLYMYCEIVAALGNS